MRVKKILSSVREKINEYPKIDSIIEGLELSKNTENSKDVNSFIKSKNKINRAVELQAIKNINIDQKIDEYKKWQKLIKQELDDLKANDIIIYKLVMFRFTGYSFEKIKDELLLGERTVTRLYNDFVIEIAILAVKNGIIYM